MLASLAVFSMPLIALDRHCLCCGIVVKDSRLSERFSPERERLTYEGEILGYTEGFSPERKLSRLGEKWHFGTVETVRFSLERESLA
ncbi:hypothetical protein Lal_00006022 [Lupinus albus]|nr:hypothetical protein Lal_00006022 [Lupinus albus]